MSEPRNRVVQLRRFGGPDALEVVDAPLPTAGRGEVRVRVLASSVNYTEVLIRRRLYPQTMRLQPPFVLGYDVVGEIDQLGDGVRGFQVGDRVADMTVVGSNAAYRTLRADALARLPAGIDPAEAATLILSWTTAYQLLHRSAHVAPGQRVLVHGAAGAVGQALLALGRLAGLEVWGAARGEHAAMIHELGAKPINYQREDFTRVLPGGFDVVFDGIGEDGYRRSFAALKPGGLLLAIGFSASVQAQQRMRTIVMSIARMYFWRFLPGGKHARFYSINVMRARHPAWFREDLERLFGLLATGAIRPRVAERISFDEVAEAHRRLEAGGLEGKLVLCPDLPSRRDQVPPQLGAPAVEAPAPSGREELTPQQIGKARRLQAAPALQLPLLGSNQDSPDPDSSRLGGHFGQPVWETAVFRASVPASLRGGPPKSCQPAAGRWPLGSHGCAYVGWCPWARPEPACESERMMRALPLFATAVLAAAFPAAAFAQGRQQFADLGTCFTAQGEVVRECRVGYRTFGRLNERGDNAVLVPSWHGGRSETMTFILGPGGWVDTTRYFAVLVDKPGNGVSISPSNSRSQPGQRFPRLTVGDMVAAEHRAVVEHLGIRRLHAVVGWSMGGMQAIEWALRFPEAVDRIVSVAGTPLMGSYEMYFIRSMLTLLDLGTRSGLARDTLALRLAELWHTVATTPAHENALSRDSVSRMIAAEARQDWLDFHPEDNRLQLEAVERFDALGEVRTTAAARPHMLLLFMPEDHVTTAESFREFARLTGADTVAFASRCGHMAPVCETAAIGEHVQRYLEGAPGSSARR